MGGSQDTGIFDRHYSLDLWPFSLLGPTQNRQLKGITRKWVKDRSMAFKLQDLETYLSGESTGWNSMSIIQTYSEMHLKTPSPQTSTKLSGFWIFIGFSSFPLINMSSLTCSKCYFLFTRFYGIPGGMLRWMRPLNTELWNRDRTLIKS